jgi:hypothetical protein
MPELAAMELLRDRQAERLANAINDNEPMESIAREKKLLEDIDASLRLFNGIKALNTSRVLARLPFSKEKSHRHQRGE